VLSTQSTTLASRSGFGITLKPTARAPATYPLLSLLATLLATIALFSGQAHYLGAIGESFDPSNPQNQFITQSSTSYLDQRRQNIDGGQPLDLDKSTLLNSLPEPTPSSYTSPLLSRRDNNPAQRRRCFLIELNPRAPPVLS
jgi:hypothetical protein